VWPWGCLDTRPRGLSHATPLERFYVTVHDPSPAHSGGRVTPDRGFPPQPGGGGLPLSVATSFPPATVRRAAGYSRPAAGFLVASPHRHVVVHGGRHGGEMELVRPSAGARAPLESLRGAELRLSALDAPVHPPPPVADWPSIIQEEELQMTGPWGGTASGDATTGLN